MKSIKQWLIENRDEIQSVDLNRVFGGSSIQIDPRLYSKIRSKVDALLSSIDSDPELKNESKTEIYRQLVAIVAKELLDVSSKTVTASGLAKGFGSDEPIAREQV